MIEKVDIQWMRQAMCLAQHGEGWVNPNPMVGAVIVRDGQMIAQGYHARHGDLHAERNAFRDADQRQVDCTGATMYVTLEPCCHHGHQPPCTEAVIAHRIARVVVGLTDPNPLVAGGGIAQLRKAGIIVDMIDPDSTLHAELREQNRIFLHYITQRTPWVTMKYAMTLDGKITTHSGESRWITGEESRAMVHQLRKRHTAILCGIGTVLADDPMLNTRIADDPSARQPRRIVLDRRLRIPLTSQLVTTAQSIPTIVVHASGADLRRIAALQELGVVTWQCDSLKEMLCRAGSEKIDSILVEGGGTIHEAFVSQQLVQEVYAFIAPRLIGGSEAPTPVEGTGFTHLADAPSLEHIDVKTIGSDTLIHGYVYRNR